ncbi:MAG TPA: hypothetical protein VGI10_25095 [Polyangiaceae bacterium]|jgi:hypothetical protein
MRSVSFSVLLLLMACSRPEPVNRGSVFAGQGATVATPKEVPLTADAPALSGPCAAGTPASDVALVDDFEDNDAKPFKAFQREGWWFTAADPTEGGKLSPANGQFMPARLPASEASKTNLFAMHVQASGQTDWGITAGTTLRWVNEGVRCPLNVSAFQGIKFRAKGPGTLQFKVDVPGTMPPDGGGVCSKGCYDSPGKLIMLSDHWDDYLVTWDRLQQGGWGTEVRFDPARVLGIEFSVGVKLLPADFWLDDIEFVPKSPPVAAAQATKG